MKINVLAIKPYPDSRHLKLAAHADVQVGEFIFKHIYIKKPAAKEQHVKWPRLSNPSGALAVECMNPELERSIKHHVFEAYLASTREQTSDATEVDIPFG